MKKVKILLSLAICAAFLLTALPVCAASESIVVNSQTMTQVSSASVRADIYEWYYTIIDGVRYKRKYNVTQNEWVGDWIPA